MGGGLDRQRRRRTLVHKNSYNTHTKTQKSWKKEASGGKEDVPHTVNGIGSTVLYPHFV